MNETYCGTCHDRAKVKGRGVTLTQFHEYPVCSLCESRLREGLVHYEPSNGSEFDGFWTRCEVCRHVTVDGGGANSCTWKILDKLLVGMGEAHDAACFWFNPDDLETGRHGAVCKRFTHRNDNDDDGARNPPPIHDPAQMTFDDIDIPVERSPKMSRTKPEGL